jgi:Spy/CpxP family protein refolding chaperone
VQAGWKGTAFALVAVVALAGSASAQRGGGRFGGGANLLSMPEVQTELKMTAEQKGKVPALLEQIRAERPQLRDLSDADRAKRSAEWDARQMTLVGAILDANQMKRYQELVYQRQGTAALTNPAVASKLNLTSDQLTKLQAINQEANAARREAFQGGNFDRTKMEAMQKQTDEKVMAVLTAEQKTQWQGMLGAPFAFPPPQPRN